MSLASRILSLVSGGGYPGLAWLDGGDTERGWLGLEPDIEVEADSLEVLEAVGELWRAEPEQVWIGWLSYDVGASELLGRAPPRSGMPGVALRRYAGAVELLPGGQLGRRCGGEDQTANLAAALEGADPHAAGPWPLGRLEAAIEPDEYRRRVEAARQFVVAGDTYQVNLSQRLSARWTDDDGMPRRAAKVFSRLREQTPANMGALLSSGSTYIASNSPETLLDVRFDAGGDRARSWPIKGTRPRGENEESDRNAAAELLASAKDLAEHVMIVDLVRNDLGRLAVPGTVTAPTRPELVSLPTVHHLVSEVACTLREDWTLAQLVRAVFPGGSITGAPKHRTVEIIDELEHEPRGIYCGAILVLEPAGLRMSIPIRTGTLDEQGLSLRSGGGIVVDSDPESERLETIAKARAFDPAPVQE